MNRDPLSALQCSNVREIDHYDSTDLMVWAGITLDGRTYLHVFERGTVTAVMCRNEVLEPYVYLFRGAVDPDFILMDENARHIELFGSTNF
ncbi:transposable element Tcb2 transposase [Trichonephila clavipes]|nr:transposable element Tcb2 transposase [Trichonephila clavipes]